MGLFLVFPNHLPPLPPSTLKVYPRWHRNVNITYGRFSLLQSEQYIFCAAQRASVNAWSEARRTSDDPSLRPLTALGEFATLTTFQLATAISSRGEKWSQNGFFVITNDPLIQTFSVDGAYFGISLRLVLERKASILSLLIGTDQRRKEKRRMLHQ